MSVELTTELSGTIAYTRLKALFDEGTFSPIAPFAKSVDGPAEAAAGYGDVNGCPAYAFAQNSDICSGAMSKAQAAKLKKLYELALKTGTPVIGIYDSIGARVDEGVEMLTAYGDLLNLSGKLSGIVPQISVILGPCEGTAALLASTADFVIMSENGKFTINTNGIGGSLDENIKAGSIAISAKNEAEAVSAAKELLAVLPQNNLSDAYQMEDIPAADSGDLISAFADGESFIELFKGFADNVKVGFARVNGDTVGIVQTCGVITLADSEGFSCVRSAAKLTAAYAEATTAKITVVTGQAFGAFYMAVAGTGASTDVTFALEGACVSPVNPEAGLIILYPERLKTDKAGREKALAEFRADECSAQRAAEMGYIDSVVSRDDIRKTVSSALDMLSGKRETTLPKKHSTL